MDPVVVVGSGASGVHFALTALQKGRRVTMLDVGHTRPEAVRPGDTLNGLKQNLADPIEYFLGPQYESLVLPGRAGEYYAFPPAKGPVLRTRNEFQLEADGFSPLSSFGAGGLAEVWTGGCYPFSDSDLSAFPFGYAELAPFYAKVAERIGIAGTADDLAAVFPVHDGLMEPLDLDEHSAVLLKTYARHRRYLNEKFGCLLGRARVAALSRDLGGRKACSYTGRCLWGCPTRSLYTPTVTLAECRSFPGFQYVSGLFVDHFQMDSAGRVRSVVATSANGETHEFPAGSLVLAAGTLGSSRIFLESMYRETGTAPELRGLMDNRQILMPFLNLRMLGRQWNPNRYQYHQVVMAVRSAEAGAHIHALITTLKTALIHSVVQAFPFDLGTGVSVMRDIHGALAMVNINFPDNRRDENRIWLDVGPQPHRLVIHYRPESGEPERLKRAISLFRKILFKLGCIAPPAAVHVRPMGAGVHYAGTVPMTDAPVPHTCTREGASRDVENLYFVDGTTFPYLPSKNLTFTLMANATRIAEAAF